MVYHTVHPRALTLHLPTLHLWKPTPHLGTPTLHQRRYTIVIVVFAGSVWCCLASFTCVSRKSPLISLLLTTFLPIMTDTSHLPDSNTPHNPTSDSSNNLLHNPDNHQ